MYVQSIVELYHQFCKQYQNDGHQDIPLVINTHGWLKGVGYDVLVNILCRTCPTHVVQLLSSSAKKNLPHGRFWDVSSKAKTLYLKSAVEESPKQVAEHLRAVRVLAYFQQCFGEDPSPFPYQESKLFARTAMSLVCHAPYQLPIWAVDIRHLHGQVPQESWSTVNGALVGLGVSVRHKTQQEKDDTSKPLPPLCIGLGIVRGVDMKKGIFYVITPISLEQLQQVDTLLQGHVEIPEQLLQAEGHISPYLCRDSIAIEGTGAGVMKSSHKQPARRVA
jgi:polynucleotide 5'-hydroxyl-kinase GRC3/NOL9